MEVIDLTGGRINGDDEDEDEAVARFIGFANDGDVDFAEKQLSCKENANPITVPPSFDHIQHSQLVSLVTMRVLTPGVEPHI